MTDCLSVYITTPTRAEAKKIAHVLVEENLAACANIFFGMQSIFRWQGKVEHAEECALIVKIRSDKFDAIQKHVAEMHSYDCPCVVAWPIVAGSDKYIEWLRNPQ
jgi:periplasmic divalent cation tolerance protein